MEIKILKDEKNRLEVQFDNQTVAEIVRVYLNQDSDVELGVWKREHYSKPVVLTVVTRSKSAKSVLQNAISKVQKDIEKYVGEYKKLKIS